MRLGKIFQSQKLSAPFPSSLQTRQETRNTVNSAVAIRPPNSSHGAARSVAPPDSASSAASSPGTSRAEFERLALAHRARAFRFALAYQGDRDVAEDMVQEALSRLYERREQYPLSTHFGPYLVKMIARLCIDEKRSRTVRERREPERHRARTPVEDPSQHASNQERAGILQRAIGQLPERERACLLLTVCEGLSYREAADALSLSLAEVNNAVYRARMVLREQLGQTL